MNVVKVVAIAGLTVIGAIALLKGIDHLLIAGIAAIIGGLAGYEYKKIHGA